MADMNSLGGIGGHDTRGQRSDQGNRAQNDRNRGSGGYSDLTAAQARDLHRRALEADQLAADLRTQRDMLIMRLREEDEKRWSYTALAKMLGCSRELVAQIVQRNRAGGKRNSVR